MAVYKYIKRLAQPRLHSSKGQNWGIDILIGAGIFVLGLIIRYAFNFSFIQNQSLEAMRMALRWSFLSAQSGNSCFLGNRRRANRQGIMDLEHLIHNARFRKRISYPVSSKRVFL